MSGQRQKVIVPGGLLGEKQLSLDNNRERYELGDAVKETIPSNLIGLANDSTVWVGVSSVSTALIKWLFVSSLPGWGLFLGCVLLACPIIAVPLLLLFSKDKRIQLSGAHRLFLIVLGVFIA